MMTNESDVTIESKPPARRLLTSLSAEMIPIAWRTPMTAKPVIMDGPDEAEPATTPQSSQSFNRAALNKLTRKTKIIATLGPATENGEVLRGLLKAGVSIFRIDLACIRRESALKAVYAIRSISTELRRPVSLLLDTQSSPRRADSTAITESDWADFRFGLECGVDWLAVSVGRNGNAVRQLGQFLADQKRDTLRILARIEDASALPTLDENIQKADGVILGGGDLAGERPAAEMRRDWRLIVQKCVSGRKVAVFAIGDNTNVTAALDAQPDALLLAEVASVGSNPIQSVQALDGLIRQEESSERREAPAAVALATEQDEAVAAALQQANETAAEAIVVFTRSGNSACLCAALRPRQSQVFAFTPDTRLARRLRLRFGLEPIVISFSEQPKKTIHAAEKVLLQRKFLAPGAKVVYLTDILDQGQRIRSVQVGTLAATARKIAE